MRFGKAGDPTTDGRYMIHCHNLPHEDHDMMTQFRVGPTSTRDPCPVNPGDGGEPEIPGRPVREITDGPRGWIHPVTTCVVFKMLTRNG